MENKKCRLCQTDFVVADEDLEFYKKMSPSFAGKSFEIPSPTLCPKDRSRNRHSFRNLRNLTMRKCDATGESILSHFSDDVPFPVYKSDYWWGDGWDGTQFGREFDFNKTFFEQYEDLYKEAPNIARSEHTNENCDYCNGLSDCKDCYLSFNIDYCENCYYSMDARKSKNCTDCLAIVGCELCYECIRCSESYGLLHCLRCINCAESYFLSDCRSCKNCIGCCNLVNAEYYIWNRKATKEEFDTIKAELQNSDKLEEYRQKFAEFQKDFPKKYYYGHSNEDSSGDDIRHIKSSYQSFYCDDLENSKFCDFVFNSKDCYDYSIYGNNSEWIYNCLATGSNSSHNAFCMLNLSGSRDCYYSNLVAACKNCFGCASLKHKQYCILNKQYTKEEYETLVPKVIEHMKKNGEWGEFFPPQMSAYAFNETTGMEYLPLSKEEIEQRGWKYRELVSRIPQVEKIIEADQLPKTIAQTTEDILASAVKCSESGKPFQIQGKEFIFYKSLGISLPHLHPDVRHQKRLNMRNFYELFDRKCNNCQTEIKTSFSPNKPEKIYCEKCYQELTT